MMTSYYNNYCNRQAKSIVLLHNISKEMQVNVTFPFTIQSKEM